MKRFLIREILAWEPNMRLVRSNADHGGDYNSELAEAQEFADAQTALGAGVDLPWECEAEDADAALAKYAEEKYSLELAVPVEADVEELPTGKWNKFCEKFVRVFTKFSQR